MRRSNVFNAELKQFVDDLFRESPDPETKWNEKSDVNRQSHQGDYEIVNNVPR